jgi:alkylhydroperoxidase family enzyme
MPRIKPIDAANSTAALTSMNKLFASLSKGKLGGKIGERVALAIAQATAMAFALAVLQAKGRVSDATLAEARAAGLDDNEIVELVAHVALNVFTNYLNNLAGTEVDFPLVRLEHAA